VTRGDIAIVATRGTYTGKPRPAIIVQNDVFNRAHASLTICPITSDCVDAPLFRIALPPGERTGLTHPSQVMVDKTVSVPREAIGKVIGRCSPDEIDVVSDALRLWFDL
jgi:mRNA interferase MazF